VYEGVPNELLNPKNAASDKTQYAARVKKLATDFKENFRQFKGQVSREVLDAMP
jgi:ATP-dependent phosphoenolpyruvate carboxykinase